MVISKQLSWEGTCGCITLALNSGVLFLKHKQLLVNVWLLVLSSFRQRTLWRFDRNDESTISPMCWRESDWLRRSLKTASSGSKSTAIYFWSHSGDGRTQTCHITNVLHVMAETGSVQTVRQQAIKPWKQNFKSFDDFLFNKHSIMITEAWPLTFFSSFSLNLLPSFW